MIRRKGGKGYYSYWIKTDVTHVGPYASRSDAKRAYSLFPRDHDLIIVAKKRGVSLGDIRAKEGVEYGYGLDREEET